MMSRDSIPSPPASELGGGYYGGGGGGGGYSSSLYPPLNHDTAKVDPFVGGDSSSRNDRQWGSQSVDGIDGVANNQKYPVVGNNTTSSGTTSSAQVIPQDNEEHKMELTKLLRDCANAIDRNENFGTDKLSKLQCLLQDYTIEMQNREIQNEGHSSSLPTATASSTNSSAFEKETVTSTTTAGSTSSTVHSLEEVASAGAANVKKVGKMFGKTLNHAIKGTEKVLQSAASSRKNHVSGSSNYSSGGGTTSSTNGFSSGTIDQQAEFIVDENNFATTNKKHNMLDPSSQTSNNTDNFSNEKWRRESDGGSSAGGIGVGVNVGNSNVIEKSYSASSSAPSISPSSSIGQQETSNVANQSFPKEPMVTTTAASTASATQKVPTATMPVEPDVRGGDIPTRTAPSTESGQHDRVVGGGGGRPCFQRPVNKKSNLIANGWIEQQRRSKMRIVWKDILASLVEGRKPKEETTLWIQRQVTNPNTQQQELEALHQIPMKWIDEVRYVDLYGDYRFSIKIHNVPDEFQFRTRDAESAMNWTVALKAAVEASVAGTATSSNSVGGGPVRKDSSASAPAGVGIGTSGTDNSSGEGFTQSSFGEASSVASGGGGRMKIKELRMIAETAGYNTRGMERSDLERIAARLQSGGGVSSGGGPANGTAAAAPPPSHAHARRQTGGHEFESTRFADFSGVDAEKVAEAERRQRQEMEARHTAERERQQREAEIKRQREAMQRQQQELQRYQEQQRRQQELQRQQEIQRQQEAQRQQEMQRQEELRRQQELQRQQEMQRRQEELRRQQEMQRQQEMKRQEEFRRQQELQRQQEMQRQQEQRRQQEQQRQQQEQQQRWQQHNTDPHGFFNGHPQNFQHPGPTHEGMNNGPPPPPQQPSAHPHSSSSPLKEKYKVSQESNISTRSDEDEQAAITKLKRNILIHWALQPPNLNTLRPIEQLVLNIQTIFPPAFNVAPHTHFTKWKPFNANDIFQGTAPDETKLTKAVRKIRFFLHPDRLPKDLNPEQAYLCRMVWDVVNDSYEEHQANKDALSWVHN